MPYCSVCGSKVESGERFCPNCGQERQPEVSVAPDRQPPARKSGRLLLILIPLVVIAVVAGVFLLRPAPVITVPGDHPTIQAAIEAAQDGEVIVVEPGTYRENIDFKGKAITLRSTAPDDPEVVAATIIDGGNNGSVVTFRTGETGEAVLSGFTITGGSGTREVFEFEYEGRKEEIEGYFGGGILVIEGSSPTIEKNTITGNTADWGGGITVMVDSSPTITGNTITGNTADRGGGGGGILVVVDSSPTIKNNTITGNTAVLGGGGGMAVMANSSPTIEGNTITGNTADRGVGGGIVVGMSSPAITGNAITGNTADEGGGILVMMGSSPAITGNTIAGNTADRGGGGGIVVADNSSPTIEGNTITGNTADRGGGGGIAVMWGSSPTIENNTITGNTADEGGAIWVSGCSTLHLRTPDDNIYRDNVPDDIYYE